MLKIEFWGGEKVHLKLCQQYIYLYNMYIAYSNNQKTVE